MNRYKPYPQYKDSGVEWLGEVPEHWEIDALRRSLIEHKQGFYTTESYNDHGIKLLRITDLQESGKISYKKCPRVSIGNSDKSFLLKNGDFVFARTGGAGSFGYINQLNEDVIFASYLIRFRFSNIIIGNYLKYFFMSSSFINAIESNIHGGVNKNIHAEDIKNQYVTKPPKKEQQSIANFLDNATCKIDTLIQKQQNLIELLKEKRQTAVENIIMQDKIISMRLGMVVDQIFRPVDRKIDECYVALGLYNRGRGLFHKEPKEGSDLGDSNFYWIQNGDLILSGQFAWEGSVALAGESENDCIVSHRYPVLRGKANILNTEYLWAFLTTEIGDFILNEHSVGSAGRNRPLNINTLMKEKIPVPNFEAQLKISRIVQIEKKISKSISKTIELLKERRTALISAVVTGKIDVRGTSI